MTGPISGPDELSKREQKALESLLFRLADDEFVLAERYTEWQIYAPTLESDLALANIAQDEFGHARLWYDLLGEFGYTEPDLIWERPPEQWQHSTLVELSFPDGGWADAIVRGYLYDTAEQLRLEALADSSYLPLADRIEKVLLEERYHRQHAGNWLERLASGEGHDRVVAAVERLFPHAMSLFAPGPHEDNITEFGFRSESLQELRRAWLDTVIPTLDSLSVPAPEPDEVVRPDATGRDGSHTDDWFELYDAFTYTYTELENLTPVRLRGEGA